MQGHDKPIAIEDMIAEVALLKATGHRLVTLSCVNTGPDDVELLYHFDKNLELKHLRLTVSRPSPVPSISAIYMAAFLVENEIQDLFDIRFDGLIIDYDRTLFLSSEIRTTPFCSYRAKPVKAGKKSVEAEPEKAP